MHLKQTAPSNSTPNNETVVKNAPYQEKVHTIPISTAETQPPPFTTTAPTQATIELNPHRPVDVLPSSNFNTLDPTQSFFTLTDTDNTHTNNVPLATPLSTTQNKRPVAASASDFPSAMPEDVDANLMNTILTIGEMSVHDFGLAELEAYLRLENLISDSSDSGSASVDNSTDVKRQPRKSPKKAGVKKSPRKEDDKSNNPQRTPKQVPSLTGGFSLGEFIENEIRSSESASSENEQADDIILYITSASTSAKKTRASTPRGDINPNIADNLLSFESNLSTISGISKHINPNERKHQ